MGENELLFCKRELASMRMELIELRKYKEKHTYSYSLKRIMFFVIFVCVICRVYYGLERKMRGNGMLFLP